MRGVGTLSSVERWAARAIRPRHERYLIDKEVKDHGRDRSARKKGEIAIAIETLFSEVEFDLDRFSSLVDK